MRILEITTVQTGTFLNLIKGLKDITEDVNLKITNGGLSITTVDNTLSVMLLLKLDADSFEKYVCTKDQTVGLHLSKFFRVIKSMNKFDILTLYVNDDDPNRLGIEIKNSVTGHVSNSKLKFVDLADDDFTIKPMDFSVAITMPAIDFNKIFKDMSAMFSFVNIKTVGEKLIFSCKDDHNSMTFTIGDDDKNEDHDIIQGHFELKTLVLSTRFTNLCKNISMYMKNDYPLIIEFAVGSLGSIYFCQSPLLAIG